MNLDFSPLYQTFSEAIVTIGVTLIGLGVYYIKQYVKSKIENEELKNSLLLTLTTVENSVKSSILNMGDIIEKALADGKITQEELDAIKSKAREQVFNQISPKLQERLQAHINDVDKFIEEKVEAEIQKLKSRME